LFDARASKTVLGVVDITIGKSTVVSSLVGQTLKLFNTTTKDRITGAKTASVSGWASHGCVDTSPHWVASINGTVVAVFTEEDLIKDATNGRLASISGTDAAVVTDGWDVPVAVVGSRRSILDTSIFGTSIAIITFGGIGTHWAVVRAVLSWVGHTGLVQDLWARERATDTTVGRHFINDVFLPLTVVEAIANGKVGPSFSARSWAKGDFSNRAGFVKSGTISP